MRASSAALAAATMAVVAGGAAAGDAQEQRELRVPDDARVTILGAKFAPGFPRSTPVEAAGDVNGDGTPDLLVRNRQEHAGDQTHSYLIFGGRLPARLSLDRLGRSGRALLKSAAGDRIIPVGDVNSDGAPTSPAATSTDGKPRSCWAGRRSAHVGAIRSSAPRA